MEEGEPLRTEHRGNLGSSQGSTSTDSSFPKATGLLLFALYLRGSLARYKLIKRDRFGNLVKTDVAVT